MAEVKVKTVDDDEPSSAGEKVCQNEKTDTTHSKTDEKTGEFGLPVVPTGDAEKDKDIKKLVNLLK